MVVRGLRLSAGLARDMLGEDEQGPDGLDWRWIQAHWANGRRRALDLTATLAREDLDVRRLARCLRHHPSTWEEVRERLGSRLPGAAWSGRSRACAGSVTCLARALTDSERHVPRSRRRMSEPG
jgi:hypothetical protein